MPGDHDDDDDQDHADDAQEHAGVDTDKLTKRILNLQKKMIILQVLKFSTDLPGHRQRTCPRHTQFHHGESNSDHVGRCELSQRTP